jgi:hypothetical protein
MRSTGWQTAHSPDQQVSPSAHALPQLPQLFGSVCSFTQTLPHGAEPPPHPPSSPEELPDEPPEELPDGPPEELPDEPPEELPDEPPEELPDEPPEELDGETTVALQLALHEPPGELCTWPAFGPE